MQRLNFSTRALDDIESLSIDPKDARGREYIKTVLSMIRGGQKFILPDNGELVADQFSIADSHVRLFRLPYPRVVLEYRCRTDSRFEQGGPSEWDEITLAEEAEHNGALGAFITSVSRLGGGKWLPTFGAAFIPYEQAFAAPQGRLPVAMSPVPTSSSPEIVQNAPRLTYELAMDVSALVNLCACLNCENVETETLAAPTALNKKREKKGRPPLFEYKTLVLTSRGASGGQSQGGTHSSPRIHLRRGHIRRIAPDRTVWVRPTVVGDKSRGVVHKDYDATRLGKQTPPH